MAGVKTVCEMETYPDDHPIDIDRPKVIVRSHWDFGDRVHICIGNEECIVLASDIILAVEKASNR